MNEYRDPFKYIYSEISELKHLILEIKDSNKEDYNTKYYTYNEVAKLLKVEYQTILNYVKLGKLRAEKIAGILRIHHFEIFNEDFTLKNLKHKRKA